MYSRILVGTDGSATAAKAVERAVSLAKATGATVTVVSAGPKEHAQQVARQAADEHTQAGVTVEAKAISGEPATALLDEAAEGAYDLLVVGNKGMTGASRFLLGSVPNKVSHHAPCALLIVHTTD